MLKISKPTSADFLAGGGEMGALMRAYDWSGSRLGKPETWPQSLRTAVRILLNTNHPMFIWWGSDLIQFYNDAYRQTMGPERHPSALGQGGRECWAEIWDIIGRQIEQVMSGGGATWHENQLVPVTRHGKLEQVYWTYGYSPVLDDQGQGQGGENQRLPPPAVQCIADNWHSQNEGRRQGDKSDERKNALARLRIVKGDPKKSCAGKDAKNHADLPRVGTIDRNIDRCSGHPKNRGEQEKSGRRPSQIALE